MRELVIIVAVMCAVYTINDLILFVMILWRHL
jgi:hypothetical protein